MKQKTTRKGIYSRYVLFAFIAYLLILAWIVLFKMNIPSLTGSTRRIIWTITAGELFRHNSLRADFFLLGNIAGFIPAGIFFYLLIRVDSRPLRAVYACLACLGLTVFFEVAQYVLAIGVSSVGDVILNLAGGAIGVIISLAVEKHITEKFVNNVCKWVFYIAMPIGILTVISTVINVNLYI